MDKKKLVIVGGIVCFVGTVSAIAYKILKGRNETVAVPNESRAEQEDNSRPFLVIPKDEEAELNPDMFDCDDVFEEKIVPDANGGISVAEAFHKYMPELEEELYSVITEDEYMAADESERHCCTYFVLDDVLAGVDGYLNEISPEFDLYLVGVNALMNTDENAVFVKNNETGETYEIVASEANYLEAYAEANGGCLPIMEDGEEDGEDREA